MTNSAAWQLQKYFKKIPVYFYLTKMEENMFKIFFLKDKIGTL